MNWSLSVSSTDWNYQIWFILTMTKSPQFHNRDPQFQFIRFQNEWLLSKMRFPRNRFLEFGLIRKPVSYQIRKIAFLLSGKWLPISYHLISRLFLNCDWLILSPYIKYGCNLWRPVHFEISVWVYSNSMWWGRQRWHRYLVYGPYNMGIISANRS